MIHLGELAERLELPGEALGACRITVTGGNRAVIENHKGLLEYTPETVEVSGGKQRLRISGAELVLRAMSRDMLIITGKIFEVEVI